MSSLGLVWIKAKHPFGLPKGKSRSISLLGHQVEKSLWTKWPRGALLERLRKQAKELPKKSRRTRRSLRGRNALLGGEITGARATR
jgi:hypothetical protein